MTGLVLHSAFFFLFSLLTGLFSFLFFFEDNPRDKKLLLFAFLVASLFMVCAAKSMIEISLLP